MPSSGLTGRRSQRLSFQPHELPPAALIAVCDREQRLAVRVTQISSTAAAALAPAALRGAFSSGMHYWLDVNLPGEARPVELMLRLLAIEPAGAEELNLSFRTCGGDDGAYIVDALERVARGIARGAAAAGCPEGATC